MSTSNSARGFTEVASPEINRTRFSSIIALFLALLLGFSNQTQAAAEKTLMVMGDSLSAAYGVQVEQAWVSLLEQRLDEENLNWQVANESISGETTGGGLRRLPELLAEIDPDLVVIELGGNDGLRGFPPQIIRENLARMIELSQQSGAEVLLVGMQIPPNYGSAYTKAFRDIFPALAEEYQTALVPFFLEGVYNREGAMQSDGIHPTAAGQPQLLDNVWPELKGMLEAEQTSALN